LEGEARDTQIESFKSGKDWYRGVEVDSLSRQEAATIAARLVHRVQAKVSLAREKAKVLEVSLAKAFERRFIGGSDNPDPTCKREQLVEELSIVARENLDEDGIRAFQEAVAKGIRPQPDDKEETEVTAPDCCSLKCSAQN
jgi:hypothetical protein